MPLKFEARCDVCDRRIRAGAVGYWHGRGQGVTCDALTCASVRGLTVDKWVGSPVSGKWVPTLSDTPRPIVRDPAEDAADRWSEAAH